MLTKSVRYLIALIILWPISFAIHAEKVQLQLDPEHSYVMWHVEHLGFSVQTGKWYVNGVLVLDKENPEKSQVKITVKLADLVTGLPELDKHLKGPLFFDVAKFPTATFVSDKVDVLGKTAAKVHGILTLHGVSKPIILDVTLNKIGKNPINDKDTVGFTANTTIKRSDFGIKTFLPQVGDEVKIDINAEAFKVSPHVNKK